MNIERGQSPYKGRTELLKKRYFTRARDIDMKSSSERISMLSVLRKTRPELSNCAVVSLARTGEIIVDTANAIATIWRSGEILIITSDGLCSSALSLSAHLQTVATALTTAVA